MAASSADRSSADQSPGNQAPADRPPGEKRKMTVSERSLGELAAALQDWLASQPGAPGRPTVSGVRLPESAGLSSTSVLFEVSWPDGADDPGPVTPVPVTLVPATWRRATGRLRGPAGPRAGRGAGVPPLRPARPVRGDQPGGRAQRRPGAEAALERAGRRPARHAVLRHGPGRRPDPARQPALRVRRLAAARPGRRSAPGSSGPASGSWPGCTRSPIPPRRSRCCGRPAASTRCAAT